MGIVWAAGQADHNWADDGALQALKKSQLGEIVRRVNDVQWIKLQFNEPAPFREIKEVDLGCWLDTAGLIFNLDAVVCVDTAAMHLANAMRKPTYILSSGATNWRLVHADVYYPGAKLFRSFKFGYDDAIEELITELQSKPVSAFA